MPLSGGYGGAGPRPNFRVCSPWIPTSAHPSLRCGVVDVLEVLLAPPNREFRQFRGEAGRECNLRRTKGERGRRGGSNQAFPGSASEHSSPPPAKPLLSAPPASRPWACSRGSAARHWGPRGLGGGPQDRLEGGLRGGRGAASAAKELGPAKPAPLPSAPRSLFLIRVMGAVPARLPSVCKRLTRGPALNPLGAGPGLLLGAWAGA